MASYEELIAGLTEKRNELLTQVEKINAAIDALGGSVAAPAKAAAPKAAAPAAEDAPRRGRKPKAEAAPAPTKKGKGGGRPAKEIRLVNEIQDASSWNEKVVWAINKAGIATTDEIATAIASFDGSDFDKVKTIVSSTASTLFKKGAINAVREGRGFKYSLK